MKSFILLAPALALAGVAVSVGVAAQQHGTHAQRADNARRTSDLRARIGQVEARIGMAQRSRKITATRAAQFRGQARLVRQGVTRLASRQGFVSAAELASYNRTLGAIDIDLDRRGVARSYGNDMLTGGPGHGDDRLPNGQRDETDRSFPTAEHSYGDDALDSAEVTAFKRADARLRYRDARIKRDTRGCAVYQGKARDGRVRSERLLSPSGQPICERR